MAERGYLNTIRGADVERSTEDIRQDIAKGKENISQTFQHIEERIVEKLDWREYVKDSPYWTLGAAAGFGYLASGMFRKRASPLERFLDSIAGEVRDSLGGLRAAAVGPGLVKVTLLGMATKAAAHWLKKATSTIPASQGAGPRPDLERGSTISPNVNK